MKWFLPNEGLRQIRLVSLFDEAIGRGFLRDPLVLVKKVLEAWGHLS
jgi:hypothetical protein